MDADARLDALVWPLAQAAQALDALAREAGLQPRGTADGALPEDLALDSDPAPLERWIAWAGARRGLEALPVATPQSGIDALLRGAGPALLQVPARGDSPAGWLLLLRSRLGRATLIGPDLRRHRRPLPEVRERLCARPAGALDADIDRLLDLAGLGPRRHARARQALLDERLAQRSCGRCWMLRLPASAGFVQQLLQARLPAGLAALLAVFAGVYLLELTSWSLIGASTLDGRADLAWLAAWALLVLSLVPLRLLGGWLDVRIALGVGRLLKARLMAGMLRMDIEQVRRLGAGELLSRVMEAQALESLALQGGLGLLVSVLELLFAASVLALGASGPTQMLLLAGWVGLVALLGWRYFRRLRAWTAQRLAMTHALVEDMVGHRTRLAQEPAQRRQAQDDQTLVDYLARSQAVDRSLLPTLAVLPRGWMVVGLLGLAPAFVLAGPAGAAWAISLGGLLLANRALGGIAAGIASIARATLAWQQVGTLFQARGEHLPASPPLPHRPADAPGRRLVDATGLGFCYPGSRTPVLQDLDLTIHHGDRVLLEGPSGGGKSTLASLLTGLRQPGAGLLLLDGLDRPTLGPAWHERATEAPQFHENHILSGSLAFNLLMGRQWPASEETLALARTVCVELGLGDLLARMPSGLMQMVGETGWQLSHGERSRIFLARALLQQAPLTVLDESFAALDPQTLERCLRTTLRRASTLVVIAHP
ncbi:MAG: ABC transporter ATP-binding protein [Rhodoferax sp.]